MSFAIKKNRLNNNLKQNYLLKSEREGEREILNVN